MITASTTQPLQPGVLTVSIEDMSMVRDIKKAISMLRGVTKVSQPKRRQLSSMEQSMEDIREGRIEKFASSEDMFRSLGI
ncbi:MAG: hypothetical protein IJ887_03405 [Prevotella sp.]|jgi:hypothetical protein|nr:hypothetical protein [Prevotella sp.]MBR6188756.1 hypothetical protein [Prevotella sp.]